MSEIKNESINFKYWDEMTPEERVQFDLDMWTDKKPDEGGPECVIKFFPLSAAALQTTIQTLDALSDAMALDAETVPIEIVQLQLDVFDFRMCGQKLIQKLWTVMI